MNQENPTIQTHQVSISVDTIRTGLIGRLGADLFATLTAITAYMNDHGEAYPTQKQIGEITGVSERTALRRVNKLLEFKLEDGSPIITREKLTVEGSNYAKYSYYKILPASGFVMSDLTPYLSELSYKDNNINNRDIYSKDTLCDKPDTHPDNTVALNAKDVISYFCQKYRETYGATYSPNYARDGSMIKNKLIKNYDAATTIKIIDTVFVEYDNRWKKPQYPRPTIGQLVSWLANEALAVAEEAEKEQAEQTQQIEVAQNDPRLSKDYFEKVLKKLGSNVTTEGAHSDIRG